MNEPRLGSIILWPRDGTLADSLACLIKKCDRDKWIRANFDILPVWPDGGKKWPWHSSQILGYDNEEGWIVDEEVGPPDKESWIKVKDVWKYDKEISGGDRRIPLDLLQAYRDLAAGHPVPRLVINILPRLSIAKCDRFIKDYKSRCYDSKGYLAAGGNRIDNPLTHRPLIPARIVDDEMFCWERTIYLCDFAGHPVQSYCDAPFIFYILKALYDPECAYKLEPIR